MEEKSENSITMGDAAKRLPYEAPELIVYNASEVTKGGVSINNVIDSVNTFTSYKPLS